MQATALGLRGTALGLRTTVVKFAVWWDFTTVARMAGCGAHGGVRLRGVVVGCGGVRGVPRGGGGGVRVMNLARCADAGARRFP